MTSRIDATGRYGASAGGGCSGAGAAQPASTDAATKPTMAAPERGQKYFIKKTIAGNVNVGQFPRDTRRLRLTKNSGTLQINALLRRANVRSLEVIPR
jgi:hypothetical protein